MDGHADVAAVGASAELLLLDNAVNALDEGKSENIVSLATEVQTRAWERLHQVHASLFSEGREKGPIDYQL